MKTQIERREDVMKKWVSAVLAGTMLAGSSLFAVAGEGEGVIASVDAATRTIILEDGSTWVASENVDISELASGDAIKVVYEDGTTMLTEVTKVE